jgi:hypothetical protein
MKTKPIEFKCECGKPHKIDLDDIYKHWQTEITNKIEEALFKNGN